jgi:hypothetical protein
MTPDVVVGEADITLKDGISRPLSL